MDGVSDAQIREILARRRRIAVVGASNKPERASFYVAAFLAERGHTVTPINPGIAGQVLHGAPVVASLAEAGPLEMVDIFRASDQVAPVVDAAIAHGAKIIWMQLGVKDERSAAKARASGLVVVMDRCPIIETQRLALGPPA